MCNYAATLLGHRVGLKYLGNHYINASNVRRSLLLLAINAKDVSKRVCVCACVCVCAWQCHLPFRLNEEVLMGFHF